MNHLIKFVEEQTSNKQEIPAFKAGDTITVHLKIKEMKILDQSLK